MDPATVAIAAASYAGSLVAHRCAEGALEKTWTSLKAWWWKRSKEEILPEDLHVKLPEEEMDQLATLGQMVLAQAGPLRRARLVEKVFDGAEILWIDDDPEFMMWERRLLEALGSRVTQVQTSTAASELLGSNQYDLVLSDIARAEGMEEGVRFAQAENISSRAPLIFYVLNLKEGESPAGAFGITNRPDELLDLICDVLERTRI